MLIDAMLSVWPNQTRWWPEWLCSSLSLSLSLSPVVSTATRYCRQISAKGGRPVDCSLGKVQPHIQRSETSNQSPW